jgi:phosphomevalonate kinase
VKKLILVTGKMKSGKDTFCDILNTFNPINQFAFATKVKEITAEICGLTMEQLETYKAQYRTNLIFVGTVGRKLDPNMWIKQLIETESFNKSELSIITDVRFKNELNYKFDGFKTITVRIKASEENRIKRGANEDLLNDASEVDLDDIPDSKFDIVIENNGSKQEFEKEVLKFRSKFL